MSFSSEVKEEVNKLNTYKDKKQVVIELIGYFITSNCSCTKTKVKFSTENEYNINRFGKLLSNLQIEYTIEIQGNIYSITFKKPQDIFEIEYKDTYIQPKKELEEQMLNENLVKAFVRGSFLGGGSLNNPHKGYHLEILFSSKENALFIKEILKTYTIQCKELQRNTNYSIYIKEGEDISKLLAMIGASNSVLKFEEIRVLKETRNNINRIVNCETANLNKTVTAAVRQVEAIKYIKQKGKFEELPEGLKEIAELRIKNTDISLIELGKMLKEPIGKSGVNYRLKKILEIAEDLK